MQTQVHLGPPPLKTDVREVKGQTVTCQEQFQQNCWRQTEKLLSRFLFKDFTCSCVWEFNSAFGLCPQTVLLMQSRRTSRTSHSPLNHRRLPTGAEETPPVGNPASSWVESAFFCLFNSFLFIFLKINAPPLSSSTSAPPSRLRLSLVSHSSLPSSPLCPPSTLLFLSFFFY